MMDWDKKKIPLRQTDQEQKERLRSPSPALVRFFGCIGFIACGLGILYLGQQLFGVDSAIWRSSNWNANAVVLFIGSLVAALFGSLIGMSIGASIDIKSEQIDHVLNALWHFLANGSLIWFILLTLCLTKIYGKEGVGRFADEIDKLTIVTLAISTVGCILIGATLLAVGLLKDNSKPKVIPCLILSLPIGIAMGYAQFRLLAIDSKYWIFMGIMLPVMLIPISAFMMNRDKEQRRQLLELQF